MRKLRRFYTSNKYELREHKEGIAIYKMEIMKGNKNLMGIFRLENGIPKFRFNENSSVESLVRFDSMGVNRKNILRKLLNINIILTDEAIEYLESLEIMKRLVG